VVLVLLVLAGVGIDVARLTTVVGAAALRVASLRLGWRTPTDYDVWGGLEARIAAGGLGPGGTEPGIDNRLVDNAVRSAPHCNQPSG